MTTTTAAWAALRQAATLVHSVPSVAVRVRDGERVIADVRRHPGDPQFHAAHMNPCEFRAWVAEAWAADRAAPAELVTIDGVVDVAVDVGLPVCGATLAGGLYRVPILERELYVVTTTADIDVAGEEAAEIAERSVDIPGVWGIGLRNDPATEICLAYCEVDRRHHDIAGPRVVDLLEELVARVAVRQLIDWLPDGSWPGTGRVGRTEER
ncbi:MAG TPA: hypothetical protein VGM93_05670 [Acidimicrobiales bacterium]